jgi:hypothetical protein
LIDNCAWLAFSDVHICYVGLATAGVGSLQSATPVESFISFFFVYDSFLPNSISHCKYAILVPDSPSIISTHDLDNVLFLDTHLHIPIVQ